MSKRIMLDPGHGGTDPGAVANGMRESDINLEVSLLMAEELKRAGLDVRLTRNEDIALTVSERWQAANTWGADLLLSIHANAFSQPTANGTEAFIFDNGSERARQSRRLAESLLLPFVERFGTTNRGVRLDTQSQHNGLGVLRNTRMPAVLFELAFMSASQNFPDVLVLKERRHDMAATLAGGILQFLGIDNLQNDDLQTKQVMEQVRFNIITEVPEWGRPTIKKLIDFCKCHNLPKGILRGNSSDGTGLDLSLDMVRMFVVLDRAGIFDNLQS